MAGYGDDSGFAAWLSENGYTLPEDAPAAAVLRQRGSVYVDGQYGGRFVGLPAAGYAQERQWPRVGAVAGGQPIPNDVVPPAVINASYEAALQEARDPASLSVIGSSAVRVKREKVEGAVEVEYQSASADQDFVASIAPVMTIIEGMLVPYLRMTEPGLGLWAV